MSKYEAHSNQIFKKSKTVPDGLSELLKNKIKIMIENNLQPLVSIITPSFNQGVFLEETINSVLNQTYHNIEYIIIDGGSTDDSVNIIKKYEDKLIYWISEPDRGQADAINKGFKKITGDLVCYLNSDDLLYPDFVSKRVQQFLDNPSVDFIYGDVHQGKDTNHKRLRKGKQTDFFTMLKTLKVPIPQQSTMWRKSVVDKIGYMNEKWHVLLDREYFMHIARSCTIKYFQDTMAFFRNHKLSKSINEEIKWAEEIPILYHEIIIENIYSLDDSILKRYKNKVMIEALLHSSDIYRVNGENALARDLERKAKTISFMFWLVNRAKHFASLSRIRKLVSNILK